MGRQGEGGGLKILKNEETSFVDDPLAIMSIDSISSAKMEFWGDFQGLSGETKGGRGVKNHEK